MLSLHPFVSLLGHLLSITPHPRRLLEPVHSLHLPWLQPGAWGLFCHSGALGAPCRRDPRFPSKWLGLMGRVRL